MKMMNQFFRNVRSAFTVAALVLFAIAFPAMAQVTTPFTLSGGGGFNAATNTSLGGIRTSSGSSTTTLLGNTCGTCADNIAQQVTSAGGEASHNGTGLSVSEGLLQASGGVLNAGFSRDFTGEGVGGGAAEGDDVSSFFLGNLTGTAALTSCNGQTVCDGTNGISGSLTAGSSAFSIGDGLSEGPTSATGESFSVFNFSTTDVLSAPVAP